MKQALYLVLKGSPKAFETLEDIKKVGFNATVVSTESLKKAVEYFPEEHHFFNLRHLENEEMEDSLLCIFVNDEESIKQIKEVIRNKTNNFKDLKGFMYSFELLDYEGSI